MNKKDYYKNISKSDLKKIKNKIPGNRVGSDIPDELLQILSSITTTRIVRLQAIFTVKHEDELIEQKKWCRSTFRKYLPDMMEESYNIIDVVDSDSLLAVEIIVDAHYTVDMVKALHEYIDMNDNAKLVQADIASGTAGMVNK